MNKNIVVVTGGAGFVGSNLIQAILKYKQFRIISIDNYSSGSKKNHIISKRVKYINSNCSEINLKLFRYKKKISAIFHFGEFSRIYQSFKNFDKCFHSNSIGSGAVFKFCLDNRIKLIYSATSASLGNRGNDKNLSPYAFTKSKNLELLENLKKWFNFKFEVIFFYNVYGPRQIGSGYMATVIGIFENQYLTKQPLTVVKPGTQTRRFTHVNDTINICIEAWRKNRNCFYSVSSRESISIIDVARIFNTKIKFLPQRSGERYASALTNMKLSNRVYRRYGKIKLTEYIREFIKTRNKK